LRQRRPASFSPAGTGSNQSFLGALNDDVAFELAHGHEDRREELAGRCARVDLFLDADDLDTLLFETIDDGEEVFSRTAEAREALDDEEVAVAEDLLELCELRAFFGCAGDFLDEEAVVRDAVGLECVELTINVLGLYGDACITEYHVK